MQFNPDFMITIKLFGIYIQEPMASLTNFLVAGVCFFAFWGICKKESKEKVYFYYKYHFLFLGLSMLLSAVLGHALLRYIDIEWKLPGWFLSMLAIMAIEQASLEQAKPYFNNTDFKKLKYFNFLVMIIFAGLSLYYLDFIFVAIYSIYGLILIVLSVHSFLYFKTKSKTSFSTITAIGICVLSVIVFSNHICLHKWFNHLALSHTLIALSIYYFYKGVPEMELEPIFVNN